MSLDLAQGMGYHTAPVPSPLPMPRRILLPYACRLTLMRSPCLACMLEEPCCLLSKHLVAKGSRYLCQDSFSEPEPIPTLVDYEDGSQSIFWNQRAVQLPNNTRWELVQDPNTAEWLVDSSSRDPNVKPKWVNKLVLSKRAREHLGQDIGGPNPCRIWFVVWAQVSWSSEFGLLLQDSSSRSETSPHDPNN